jgi:hypothetical protein
MHVQPGPIKLKSIMSTTLKVSGKQSVMISATNMNDATGDVRRKCSLRKRIRKREKEIYNSHSLTAPHPVT